MPLKANEKYYEWEGVGESWISSEDSFDSDYPSKPIKTGDPVAKWVIEDVFGLELASGDRDLGSTLPGYDVIGRNPYEVITLSLIADVVKKGIFYECYMDGEGIVNYYPIGTDRSDIGRHVLYSVDNGEMKMKCDNVMVTGYDPPPKRYAGSEFNLLTFANMLSQATIENSLEDKDRGDYPFYTTFADVLTVEACPYQYEGSIEYGGNPEALDDIDIKAVQSAGVYNPDAFEKVVTYLYDVDVAFFDQYKTTVTFTNTSVRYVELDGFGELQTRNWVSNDRYISPYCLKGKQTVPETGVGVQLPRSNERKFKGVTDVYIYGYRLKSIRLNYTWTTETLADGTVVLGVAEPKGSDLFIVELDTMLSEPFKLTKDDDYVIVQDKDDPMYSKIVFSCNVSENWLPNFGGNFVNPEVPVSFRISENSIYKEPKAGDFALAEIIKTEDGVRYRQGYLSDVNYNTIVDSTEFHQAIIFPTAEGSTGYAVEKIVAVYQWDNPSIVIRDLRNDITKEQLQKVKVDFYPIIMKDAPSPIAFSGPGDTSAKLLDPNEVRPDYDPATAQIFEVTEYARAMSSMEAGDVRVSMPFADGDECIDIASAIKKMQTDVAHDVVYICSPDAEPVLGQVVDDGVINEIDYSYQDSSQYLISVTVGPQWRGGSSWDNSLYKMETDNPVLTDTILKGSPDNIKFNVNINKIGVMECINGTKEILGVGDLVKVTLYNNPVSL